MIIILVVVVDRDHLIRLRLVLRLLLGRPGLLGRRLLLLPEPRAVRREPRGRRLCHRRRGPPPEHPIPVLVVVQIVENVVVALVVLGVVDGFRGLAPGPSRLTARVAGRVVVAARVVVVVVVVCHVAGHDGLRALLRRDGCVPHVRLCQRLVRGSRGGDDGGDGRIEVLFLVVRGRIFFRVFRWVRGCRRRDVRQLVGKRHRFLARVFLHGAHPRVPAEDDAAVEPVLEVQPVAALDVEGEVPCGLASHDGTLELEPAEVAVLDVQHGVLGVELGERADPALLDVRELPWEYRHVPGFLDARSLVDVLAVAPAEELGGHELPDGRGPDARELPAVHGGVEDLAASLGLTLFLDGERVSLLVSGGSLLRRHPRSRPRRHATPPTRSRHDDR
mmetsp:Transcript_9086/g.41115  ORF Transcript_9086/g.41115 Transcript_9086/m.41115 type:complete len:390 (+) Transcript_9086:333-1502(+)